MKITNRQADAHPSNITVLQLGRAMAQLDLAGVPPERRASAILDHLGRIMSETVTDPGTRRQLALARLARARR